MLKSYAFAAVATAALISLSACGGMIAQMHGIPIVDPNNSQDVAAHTTAEYDMHEEVHKVVGPLIFAERNLLGTQYFVRGWLSENNPALDGFVQIYVTAHFDDWAFLDRAYSHGEALDTAVIDRDVDCHRYGCNHRESVGVSLSADPLDKATEQGMSLKVSGRGGSVVLSIPAAYFAGFRTVYDRVSAAQLRGPNEMLES